MVYVGNVTEVVRRQAVEAVYVEGNGYNKAFTYEEFTSAFGNDAIEFAKKAGFVVVNDVVYAHYICYRGQRQYDGDYRLFPVELSYQKRNSSGNLITEVLHGKLVTDGHSDPELLWGVFNGDEDVVADISTPEKKELFESLDDSDIIGYWYTTYGNYWYPVCKWEVTSLRLPSGRQIDYQREEV